MVVGSPALSGRPPLEGRLDSSYYVDERPCREEAAFPAPLAIGVVAHLMDLPRTG